MPSALVSFVLKGILYGFCGKCMFMQRKDELVGIYTVLAGLSVSSLNCKE